MKTTNQVIKEICELIDAYGWKVYLTGNEGSAYGRPLITFKVGPKKGKPSEQPPGDELAENHEVNELAKEIRILNMWHHYNKVRAETYTAFRREVMAYDEALARWILKNFERKPSNSGYYEVCSWCGTEFDTNGDGRTICPKCLERGVRKGLTK